MFHPYAFHQDFCGPGSLIKKPSRDEKESVLMPGKVLLLNLYWNNVSRIRIPENCTFTLCIHNLEVSNMGVKICNLPTVLQSTECFSCHLHGTGLFRREKLENVIWVSSTKKKKGQVVLMPIKICCLVPAWHGCCANSSSVLELWPSLTLSLASSSINHGSCFLIRLP